MIEKELTMIKLNGKEYPIRCDILVLEQLQEKYGLNEFERKLKGWKPKLDENGKQEFNENGEKLYTMGEPSMSVIITTLELFIREGIDIYNDEHKEEIEMIDIRKALKNCNNYLDLVTIIYNEYLESFKTKNSLTTQGE